ncbi:MAG: hypothetical protein Kow0098_28630 [Ignavibacteriaceae bacterium]
MLKILHIAPENFAGVPLSFVQMHNSAGDFSRLVTFHKNRRGFPEDICLEMSIPVSTAALKWRSRKVKKIENQNISEVQYFNPANIFEKFYFDVRDSLRRKKVNRVIHDYVLDQFDIIHYDGGLDFFRYPTQAIEWKKAGKKIVCCYYGSDLRIRGIIRELDEISDLNITSEYDHLSLKKNLHYIFYPYDPSELPGRKIIDDGIVRIVHSPTDRKYKGTELILDVIRRIKKEKRIEFFLLENLPRTEVLNVKSSGDICIDQVGGKMGGTGYGKSGIETLAMGIPTITNMTDDYKKWLPENPFVVANNEEQLYQQLNELIDSAALRDELGNKGKAWVRKYHGFENVDRQLKELYRKYNII